MFFVFPYPPFLIVSFLFETKCIWLNRLSFIETAVIDLNEIVLVCVPGVGRVQWEAEHRRLGATPQTSLRWIGA